MTRRWLRIEFQGPLMAFGGVAVDQVRPTRDFPSASMIVGLCANALGWHWRDRDAHQALQERLVFAARRECEGALLTDTQNVRLEKSDQGWTTRGEPEGRAGASYEHPHGRVRDYHADLRVSIVVRLDPPDDTPTLDELAAALDRPARPLFLGRKPCLPSRPLLPPEEDRWIVAGTAFDALRSLPGRDRLRACWPAGEGPDDGEDVAYVEDLPDLRNWHAGYHVGSRRVVEGSLLPAAPA